MGATPSDYLRLDVNLERLEALASDTSVFGSPCDWGDVLSVRYPKCFPATEANTSKVEGASKEPVTIREIVDLEGLGTFWGVCSGKHKSARSDLIGKAVATPEHHTIGALAVPYANTNAYGRKYARGPSLQKIGRAGRDAALRTIGVDVDMENCHPSIMRILLERTHTSDGEDVDYVRRTYPMMTLYADNYKKWRNFCMGYYEVDLETENGYIIKIYYGGGCPRGDVPFLHALRVEVANAKKYLTSHRFYERLGSYYSSRRNPIVSHLSAILSFEEDSLLTYICQAMERPPICLMCDGAVFACDSIDDVSKTHQICRSLSVELGVGVCIKQWRPTEEALGENSIRSTCADLRQSSRAEDSSPLDGIIGREACLYNSIRYLNLPECYDFPQSNGPFSVDHYNQNVRSWAAKNPQSDPYYLTLVEFSESGSSYIEEESRYVIYTQSPDSPACVGHFFAVTTCQGGQSVIVADDSIEYSVSMSVSTFYKHIGRYVTIVFKATKHDPESDASSWSYLTKGGGVPKEFRTTRERCAECGGALLEDGCVDAYLYGFHAPRRIRHSRLRCAVQTCRSKHWPNYRVRSSEEVYVEEACGCAVIFVTARTAFARTFIEYIQHLRYHGFASFAAATRVHAAVFNAPSTKNFAKLLTDAVFLVYAVCELRKSGVDVGQVRIGSEISDDSLAQYNAYAHRFIFPPRWRQSVTVAVSDGHSKVMTKCGKNEKPPKRTGAPRKDHSGTALEPKPYWNGWFFFVCPKTGRILRAKPMRGPENNALVIGEIREMARLYPYLNCVVYDRACKIQRGVVRLRKELRQIRTFTTDKFHGARHSAKCPCSPFACRRLMGRIDGVNTVAAEQTFSWFGNYARTFNELGRNRHHFLVYRYAAIHNELLGRNSTAHLNPYIHQKKERSTPYACGDEVSLRGKKARGIFSSSRRRSGEISRGGSTTTRTPTRYVFNLLKLK